MQPEKRREPRAPGYAKALLVEGHLPGYVRNLSRSGCHVAFLQAPRAAVGDVLTVQVIAEHDPSIRPFVMRLLVRRITEDPPWYSVGTEIACTLDTEEEQSFERLVRYYSERVE